MTGMLIWGPLAVVVLVLLLFVFHDQSGGKP